MKRYLSLLLSISMVAAISLPLFAAGGAEESEAPGETPGIETNACDDGFRLFDHELLATDPVCIPEHPQRVTYLLYPSFLYPFGINPIGSWGLERDAENYPFIADWIADGTIDHGMPPNIEVLVGLEPDLMIYDINRVTDVVDELPTIAPLVTYDVERSSSWQQRHRFNGAVLAQEALAEAQIAEYEKRAAQLRVALEQRIGEVDEVTVSIVRLREGGVINLLGRWYTSVSVVRDVGFDLPDAVDLTLDEMRATYGTMYNARIAEELISAIDGDVLIVMGSTATGEAQRVEGNPIVAEMADDPLWRTLHAVRTGSVHTKGDYWLQSNILTAHLVIDELAEIFGVEIVTPNPFLQE